MKLGGLFKTFDVSRSGLYAQRTRMNTAANNLANISSTQDKVVRFKGKDGNDVEFAVPYRRKRPLFASGNVQVTGSSQLGVRVTTIEEDPSDFQDVYDPDHPNAIKEKDVLSANMSAEDKEFWSSKIGYVRKPNVNHMFEMLEMMEASRAYEANVTAMETSKEMLARSLRIMA